MTCDWIKENVVLYIYGELPDDARYEFEHHVRHCLACRQEVEASLALKESMSLAPVQEISPNLLADSRMKLQEALDETEQSRGWNRFVFDFAGIFISIIEIAFSTLIFVASFIEKKSAFTNFF